MLVPRYFMNKGTLYKKPRSRIFLYSQPTAPEKLAICLVRTRVLTRVLISNHIRLVTAICYVCLTHVLSQISMTGVNRQTMTTLAGKLL